MMKTYLPNVARQLLAAVVLSALASIGAYAVAQDTNVAQGEAGSGDILDEATSQEKPLEQMSEDAATAVKEELMIDSDPVAPAATETVTSVDDVMERLNENLPGIPFSDIVETSVPGLFEVTSGGQIFYVDETAQYLLEGSLIRLSDRRNLTEARMGRIHMGAIQDMDESDMLVFPAHASEDADQARRTITVFTDISCGFCRRMHGEIDTLLENGVTVRYLLFPRAGLGSQGHQDLESVWCADDPQEAMTIAKAGGEIVEKNCDNPIESHVALAQSVGLRGTPLIYTDSGEMIPGYREASSLVTLVNESQPMPETGAAHSDE